MKILIADDHPLLREALKHVLRELDSEVVVLEAADGSAVRRLVAEHADIDLALLDIRLPGVNELELKIPPYPPLFGTLHPCGFQNAPWPISD